MKKKMAAIILFDIGMCLLLFGAYGYKFNRQEASDQVTASGTAQVSGEWQKDDASAQTKNKDPELSQAEKRNQNSIQQQEDEAVKKIAITFDGEVIIGLRKPRIFCKGGRSSRILINLGYIEQAVLHIVR